MFSADANYVGKGAYEVRLNYGDYKASAHVAGDTSAKSPHGAG
jgi:hypothetical protein